jgi:hypothetical protein
MLLQLIYFFIISFFCLLWGLPIVLWKRRKNECLVLSGEDLLLAFFTGLAILSSFASWVGLFTGITFGVLILFSVPVLLFYLNKKYTLSLFSGKATFFSRWEKIFIASCLLLFLFLSTSKPTMEDSDLYHLQNIKWSNEHGTVTGLGNLYLRFGFYSSWFHTISLFHLPLLNRNFVGLNLAFVVWLFFFFLHQYKRFQSSANLLEKHLSVFSLLTLFFMLIQWNLFRVASSSTSYDFVVTGYVLICLSLLFHKLILRSNNSSRDFVLLILLIATPFFKLTGFLLLPFGILLFFYSEQKKKMLWCSIAFFLIGLVPLTVKNYLQTGYPFFPYTLFAFAKPEWQVPIDMVNLFNKYIFLSNHYINQSIPGFPLTNESSFSFVNDWFMHLVRYDQVLVIFCFLSLPIAWTRLKKIYQHQFITLLLFHTLCIVALFAWIIVSPDTRFAFGFLIFMVFFPLSILAINLSSKWYSIAIVLLSCAIFVYVIMKGEKQFEPINAIEPSVADIPENKIVLINGVNYHIPSIIDNNWNLRCINTPLPCIYDVNPYLKPRGNTLKQGFKMQPNPDSNFILKFYY